MMPILSFSLSACGHTQERDRGRSAHENGWLEIARRVLESSYCPPGGPYRPALLVAQTRSVDAHALRRQDAWHGVLHSEKP